MEIALPALYEVIDEHYLKGEDLAAYQSYQAKKQQKLVALTFDDGPNAATTPQALDILVGVIHNYQLLLLSKQKNRLRIHKQHFGLLSERVQK